jgi:hypothetical protein
MAWERRPSVATDARLSAELKRRARGGRLGCAAAFAVAEKLGIPRLEVGRAADELGIRIADCQLGCFGHGKRQGG